MLTGIILARLRPHSWAPQLAVLYDDDEINEAIQEINSFKSRGKVTIASEMLRRLPRFAPRRLDILQYCVEFSKEHRDIETMEGYLRCILELNPRDEAVKRSEH